MGSRHFQGDKKYSTVYHAMDGGGRTAPTPTVFLALEGMQVVLAVSGLAALENGTNDVGLHGFEDVECTLARAECGVA
jgi:hypothetical protein